MNEEEEEEELKDLKSLSKNLWNFFKSKNKQIIK